MNPNSTMPCNRRQFMSGVAALIAAHTDFAWAAPGSKPASKTQDGAPRILSLRLSCAAPLAEMRSFYRAKLGLPILSLPDDIVDYRHWKRPLDLLLGSGRQSRRVHCSPRSEPGVCL